jgi:predicted dehydrogenase
MKVRAGIAGAGLMGFWHAKSIEHIGGEIAAVFDVDDGAARRLANRFKGAHAITGLEETLERAKIDVLHVCTPPETHFELAAAGLSRGIHVLIEKPMTPKYDETDRLYTLAAEHGVLVCPVHQFQFQRGVRRAVAASDKIGSLRHFEATFCSAGGVGKSAAEVDAIVSEILPHPLSLMQLFVPGSLAEKGWAVTRPAAGEFRSSLKTRGTCFSILISMNSRPTATTLRLLGTSGTIHVDLFHDFCVIEPGKVSRWRKIVHPFDLSARTLFAAGSNLARRALNRELAYPGLRSLIKSYYAAVCQGLESPIPRQEGLEIAATREALQSFVRTGAKANQ